MMNRRQFISRSAAALALCSIAGQQAFAEMAPKPNKGRIGLQMYSLRNELPKDLEGSLKKVSAMGYASAELFKMNDGMFFGKTMKETKAMFTDLGMSITSAHTGSKILSEDTNAPEWDFWKKMAGYLNELDAKWAVQAANPGAKSIDDLKRIAEHYNRVGEVCQKSGIKFGYHNHNEELGKIENEVILEFLIKNTDPKLVFFQLDMGHAVRGGADCVRLLRTYPKRFPMWHASDYDLSKHSTEKELAKKAYTWLGKGNVPYPALFDLANSTGLEVLTIEQETEIDTFAAIQSDFNYLKQFKWTKA